MKVLLVVLLYAVLHIVEGYILVPYLLHRQEHLPPPLVVLSILVFGSLFGVLGVILAVPLGMAGYVLAQETVYES
jgi:predicted PurR-regulated permease PerM